MWLSTLYIMWPIHLQRLRFLRPTVQEEMHLQENTLFDLLGHTKCCQCPLHHATNLGTKFEAAISNGLGEEMLFRICGPC